MEENTKGSITPGKLADLVVLAADPHDTIADRIKNIPALRTIVNGKTVYEAKKRGQSERRHRSAAPMKRSICCRINLSRAGT